MIKTLKNPPINKTRQNLKKLHINKKRQYKIFKKILFKKTLFFFKYLYKKGLK